MRRTLPLAWLAVTGLAVALGFAPLLEGAPAARERARSVWNGDIYVVNADGTGRTRLTQHPAEEFDPAWSPDGTKIAFSRFVGRWYQIFIMNADGSNPVQLTHGDSTAFDAAWSPDGGRIAFSRCAASCHIYVMNADGGGEKRLTYKRDSFEEGPTWSPDGGRIAFATYMGIVSIDPGGGAWQYLTDGPSDDRNPAWSPSGRKLAFDGSRGLFNGDIYLLNRNGNGMSSITDTAPLDSNPAWSPDGQQIAFMRRQNKYHRARLFIMGADGSDQVNLLAIGDPYSRPSWSPDGTRLAYSWLSACKVPKLAGRNLQEARSRIERWNCSMGEVWYTTSKRPRGVVVSQRPPPRAERRIGAKVNVRVSIGR